MRKFLISLCVFALSSGAVFAAQDTTLTERESRNIKILRPWLTDNASDAETRIAAIEGTSVGGTLTNTLIIVGNGSNVATPVAVSGDATISNTGVISITTNSIVNADVNTGAAIALSKLGTTVVGTDTTNLLTEGYFDVLNTTQLVFMASGVTNVIDADITSE